MKRVVVTGMGMVSPLGNDLGTSWKSLLAGKSGITSYENDPVLKNTSPVNLSLVKDFNFRKWKVAHVNNRMNSFLAAATAEAIQHSSLDFDSIDLERVGLAVGILSSNITKTYEFSMESLKNNYQNINRLSMLHILASIPTGMLNVKYKTRGPSITVSSACASGLSSVVEGYKWIKYGEADVVIAAASEDTYNPMTLNSSLRLQAMNSKVYEDPALASCPFDQARAGFVLGEGSGALILESEEHAKKRGACILAEVLGYGTTSDGYHLVKPEESGVGQVRSMSSALKMAKLEPSSIDMVNVHATSTPVGDEIEARSILSLFKNSSPYITANKGLIGHTFASAGAIQLIFSLCSLQQHKIPLIANLRNPEVAGLNYIYETADKKITYLLKNAFGFGGINVSVVAGKYQ